VPLRIAMDPAFTFPDMICALTNLVFPVVAHVDSSFGIG
jgi:hypothetical protein